MLCVKLMIIHSLFSVDLFKVPELMNAIHAPNQGLRLHGKKLEMQVLQNPASEFPIQWLIIMENAIFLEVKMMIIINFQTFGS